MKNMVEEHERVGEDCMRVEECVRELRGAHEVAE